ncbi:Rab3 GTPase-activating protein catalytic subunit [Rhynchospora pubera]|uniref:Rab3 GTPase-activating protein catalytic subunit n=1 Tax=Rhynchospora pubera TaxID=906938 RepID=A0AAV8BUA1_9POAL|nr:Rab3 GTPase-activating protein catalytic subunit [Rhynchospora pubera]
MESSFSIVSRAKTALHSAAAKAEKVFTDIRAIDLKSDREIDATALKNSTKSIDQEGAQPSMSNKNEDEANETTGQKGDNTKLSGKVTFPPLSLLKQLAMALEAGNGYKSMTELKSKGDTSSLKEKTSSTLSVVKSLVLREKDEEEEIQSLAMLLLKSENYPSSRKNEGCAGIAMVPYLHSAPTESFVHQLSEIIGTISSLQKMGLLWHFIISEIRNLWSEGEPIPGIPPDEQPDLNCCLLYQQLQAINCCIARKKRREIARHSLEEVLKESESLDKEGKLLDSKLYAKSADGEYVLRLGASSISQDLTMLETGEPVYSPVMQEGPILTEDLIKETEEFVLRTGSVGAGCSQLLSDMQAFKAANPGCVLEDFIRWHSPPDWSEYCQERTNVDKEGSSRRGRLSDRMQKKGNLWHELWETAKPLPAVEQAPLFDEDLAVEGIFTSFEDMKPSKLFEELLATMLSVSFVAAEATINLENKTLAKLYHECKDYIIAMYRRELSKENLNDIFQVYETLEAIAMNPQEAVTVVSSPGRKNEESKRSFKTMSLNFITKDRGSLWKKGAKEDKKEKDEKRPDQKQNSNVLSSLLEKKNAIFARKPSKSEKSDDASTEDSLVDGEWTVLQWRSLS